MKKDQFPKKEPSSQKVVPSRGSIYSTNLLATTALTLKLLTQSDPTLTIKDIALKRKTSVRNVNKLYKSYRDKGYINNHRELTKLGEELIKKAVPFFPVVSDKVVPQKVRLHDLMFNIRILKKPHNWDEHRTTITSIKKYNPKKNVLAGGAILQDIVIDSVNIRITNKSILIRPPDIWEGTPRDAVNRGIDIVYHLIPKLEHLFRITLEKDKYPNILITRQHHAFPFHELAKFCQKKGVALQVRDKKGELRIITDDSHGLCELEAIHPQHAEEDAVKLQDFFEDIVLKEPWNNSTIQKIVSKQIKIITSTQGQLHTTASVAENNTKTINAILKILQMFLTPTTKPEDTKEIPKEQTTLKGYN